MIGSNVFRCIIACLLFLAASQTAKADHVAGGTLSYECLGGNDYLINLVLFRNCSVNNDLTSFQPIKIRSECGHFFSVMANEVFSDEVSQLCPTALANSSCIGGPWPGIAMKIYQAQVTLETCHDWEIYWELCTRSITNNVESSVFPCYRVNAFLNSVEAPCNNSPYLTQQSIPYVCVNQPVNFNAGFNEVDGDSLRYYLVPGLTNGGGMIPYTPGFSGIEPIPGISIGHNTGQVSFTPPSTGSYTVVIEVEEYNDSGVLIGSIRSDFMFIVEACPQPVPQPNPAGFSNLTGSGTIIDGNVIQVCSGDSFCAEIEFSSVNAASVIDLYSNVTTMLPGATLTTFGTNPVIAQICWEVPAGFSNSIPVNITAEDDACPVFGVAYWGFLVTPTIGVYGGPDVVICEGESVQLQASGDTDYLWQVYSGDPPVVGSNISCVDCPNPVVTPSESTVYLVTGLNNSSQCIATDTVVVGIALTDITAQTTSESCFLNDATIVLNIPYGSGNYSYLWDNGQTTHFLVDIPAGLYNVDIEDLDLGCSVSTTIEVAFPPFPPTYAGPDDVSCSTSYTLQAESNATFGYWMVQSGADVTFFPNIYDPNAEIIVANNGSWDFYWTEDNSNMCVGVDTVTITFTNPPPVEVEEDTGACGLSYQLNGVVPAIGAAQWTAAPGITFTPDVFDPNAVVTVPAYGEYYISWVLDVGNECGGADSVAIVFEEPVVADGGLATDSVCGATYQLQGVAAGNNRFWSSNSASISFAPDVSSPTAVVTATSPGTYQIFWTVENDYCQDSDTLQITFIEPPSPDAGADDTVCGLEYQLQATPSVGTGHWQGPASAEFLGGNDVTDALVSVPSFGTYTFLWVEDNGFTCIDSDPVEITFVEQPQANAGADASVCSLNHTMQAIASVGNGNWTADAAISISDPTDPQTLVTVAAPGSYTFTWTENNGNGCVSSDDVLVTFGTSPNANAGINQQVCGLTTALGAQPSLSAGSWSPVTGVNFISAASNPNAQIEVDASGIYELWWVEDGGFGCVDSAAVTVEFVVISLPDAGSDTEVCGFEYTLAASPAEGVGQWNVPAGVTLFDLSDPNAEITVSAPGDYTLFWVDQNAWCTDSAAVNITFVNPPTADAGTDEAVCGLEYSLQASAVAGTGFWHPVAGLSFSDENDPIATVTAADFGSYALTWEVTSGAICADTDVVEINFVEAPVANAGADAEVCGLEFTLAAIPSGGSGNWSGPATAVFSDLTDPNATVTVADFGNVTFTWTESTSFGCNATDQVVIEFVNPPTADAGTDEAVCGLEYSLQASAVAGTGFWHPVAGLSFSDENDPIATVTAADFGSYALTWEVTSGAICADTDVVEINFVEAPVANAGADAEVCGLEFTLAAIPSGGSGNWSGPATAVFSDLTDPNATVTVADFGNVTFTWTESTSFGCNATDQVVIEFVNPPTADAGTDEAVCGLEYQMDATPSVGMGFWIPDNSDVSFSPSTSDPQAIVNVPSPGVYTFSWVETNEMCESTDVVELSFVEEPVANAGANDVICGLVYELNAGNDNGQWSGPTGAVFSPSEASPTATVTVPDFGTHTFTWLVDHGNNCSDEDEVSITFNDTPAVTDFEITCIDGNINFVVSFAITGGDPDSYQVSGAGDFNGNIFTSDPIPSGADYNFEIQDMAGCEIIMLEGNHVCENLTHAGTMNTTANTVCGDDEAIAIHNSDHTLDGNDAMIFVLHTDAGTDLGDVFAENTTAAFVFVPGMAYGETYYISAVVGNGTASGGVDFSDPLLSVAAGAPIVFFQTPTAVLTGGGTACAGETIWAEVTFTGQPPFNLTYVLNGLSQTVEHAESGVLSIPLTENTELHLISLDNNQCSGTVSGEVLAVFHALPEAVISGGESICAGDVQEILVTLSGSAPFSFTYAIDGVGQPEIITNQPVFTILASQAGTYTLLNINDAFCLGETYGQAVLEVLPVPEANAGADVNSCFEGEVIPIGGPAESLVTYQWSNGEWLSDPTISNPQVIFEEEVTAPVELVFELKTVRGNCSDIDTVVVTLLPVPEIITIGDVSMCENGMVQLNASGASDVIWLPDLYIDDNTSSNPMVNPPNDQTYSVSVSNEYGCVTSGAVFVNVHPTPVVHFTANKDTACLPAMVSFQNLSTPVSGSCYWQFGNGFQSSSCNPQVSTYYYNHGVYDVSLTITSEYGCAFKLTQYEMISTIGPTAAFSYTPNPADITDSEIKFNNHSQNAQFYMWDFGDYGSSVLTNPEIKFPDEVPGDYEVCLTAIDAAGCMDEHCKVVEIAADVLVYIPNAFSPNGDGINDLFFPVMQGVDIVEYELIVFNRRGQTVWHTIDPTEKWDGTDKTREYLDDNQVYSWSLRIKDRHSTLRVDRTGSVMVVR